MSRHFLKEDDQSRLLAVCDFACISYSFDIVKFLAVADRQRHEAGCRWLDIAFVAHHADPFPTPHLPDDPVTRANHRSFAHNLALDAAKLFPAAGNVLFFSDRPAFTAYWRQARRRQPLFPVAYDPRRPNFEAPDGAPWYGMVHLRHGDGSLHAPLTVPAVDRSLVDAWLADRMPNPSKVITITLRATPLAPERNSDPAAWQALVDSYRDTDLCFVVLPDYADLYRGAALSGPHVIHCPEAVMSLSFRAALYEAAALNMMVGSGPATLCYLNPRAKYLVFGIGTDDDPAIDAKLLLQHGLHRGEQLIDGDPTRRMIWDSDRFDLLRQELDAALGRPRASSAA